MSPVCMDCYDCLNNAGGEHCKPKSEDGILFAWHGVRKGNAVW